MTRVIFRVSETGDYAVSKTVQGVSGELSSTGARSGKLTAAEREKIAGYLKEADLPGLGSGVMELAGGSGTEDGWAGSINFVQPDKKTVIRYESHGGWPTDPKAQEMLTRFGMFLDRVKVLAWRLANGTEAKPGPAVERTQH